MSDVSTLAQGRVAANRRMRAHVLVEDVSTGTRDPLTGKTTPVTVYEGRARFGSYEAHEADFESAGSSLADVSGTLHLPWNVTGIQAGHRVTCTSDPDNPVNTGRRFRIESRILKSQLTAQRWRIAEVTG